MERKLSTEALAIIKKMQQNELTESVIYEKIAKFSKGEENKKTLRRRILTALLAAVMLTAAIAPSVTPAAPPTAG